MNKIHFGVQFLICAVLGTIAYFFYQFGLIGWASFLGPLAVLIGISNFCHGQWQNDTKKRYAWNIGLSIFIYIPVGVILLNGFLTLVEDVSLADKIFNIIPETRVAWETLISETGKLFNPPAELVGPEGNISETALVQVSGRIKWSYILLPIHLVWCMYKIWASYGKPFMFTSTLLVAVGVCYFYNRPCFEVSEIQWHLVWISGFLIPFFGTWYFFKHPSFS